MDNPLQTLHGPFGALAQLLDFRDYALSLLLLAGIHRQLEVTEKVLHRSFVVLAMEIRLGWSKYGYQDAGHCSMYPGLQEELPHDHA